MTKSQKSGGTMKAKNISETQKLKKTVREQRIKIHALRTQNRQLVSALKNRSKIVCDVTGTEF